MLSMLLSPSLLACVPVDSEPEGVLENGGPVDTKKKRLIHCCMKLHQQPHSHGQGHGLLNIQIYILLHKRKDNTLTEQAVASSLADLDCTAATAAVLSM